MNATPPRAGPYLARTALGLVVIAFLIRAVIIDGPAIASGAGFWLALGCFGIAVALALRAALRWLSLQRGRDRGWEQLINACVVIAALALSGAVLEVALAFLAATESPLAGKPLHAQVQLAKQEEAARERPIRAGQAEIILPEALTRQMAWRQRLWSMPEEWALRPVHVPGAASAVTWHGVPHIFDAGGFRRLNGPFAPADPATFRIMVVGDSMTYGIGVAAEWTYPALLQRILEITHRIEVINLGVAGAASEDVIRLVARMAPALRPNLIIYGVCLNDFLPSGGEETAHAVGVPLPKWIRQLAVERTRLGQMMDDAYRNVLIGLGVSLDFWDDVLKDFSNYQQRFRTDMKALRQLGDAASLPPPVAMVLDQLPNIGSRGHHLAGIAEAAFGDAGLDVVPTEAFYRAQNGRPLFVSRWELHPNEEAHALFAVMLADHLLARADLAPFRRPASARAINLDPAPSVGLNTGQ